MSPLFLIPLAAGWVFARRLLGIEDPWFAVPYAFALAVVTTLLGVNALYRSASLATACGVTLMVLTVAAFLVLWRCPSPPLKTPKDGRAFQWFLGALVVLVLLYTNAQQIAESDDDYWIHAPLQGLMRHDSFPPFNPFFSDIPMNGHYGRNLSIVISSYLTGADTFKMQHVMTSLIQVVSFLLLFGGLRRETGSRLQALLGTVFVFFGINAGGRGGLIDTLQNNNAYVHLYLILILDLAWRSWRSSDWSPRILGGLALGGYAIVYETHFGLMFFTLLGSTGVLLANPFGRSKEPKDARHLLVGTLTILAISLPLAATQGGPLTDLLARKLEGRRHTESENLSKGMQNQAQVVKVTFPKEDLFQILLETGEYQRWSTIYRLDTPLKFLYKPAGLDRGYRYIWSWDVLKIHFLALYLSPFAAWVLIRRSHRCGLCFGAFGTIAFLVPALVDFGPIYESEYYRWQFAASLGLAGALGLACAVLYEERFGSSRPTCRVFREGDGYRCEASLSAVATFGLLGLTLVNSYACLSLVGSRMKDVFELAPTELLFFPSTSHWLDDHTLLDFQAIDWKAAQWLEANARPGDRLLTNFSEENNLNILFESTLTGVSGVRCTGHALPLDDEKIGTTPFHRAASAQLFWTTFATEQLQQLAVNWIYFRPEPGLLELPPIDGVQLVHTETEGASKRLIYRVTLEPLDFMESESEGKQPDTDSMSLTLKGPMRRLPSGAAFSMSAELTGSKPIPDDSRLLELRARRPDGLEPPFFDRVVVAVDSLGHFPVTFVTPHGQGAFEIDARFLTGVQSQEFEDFQPLQIEVGLDPLLEKIQLKSVDLPTTLKPRFLYRAHAELVLPPGLKDVPEVLACWAFYKPTEERFDLLPGINLRRVRLDSSLEVPLVAPAEPGKWRLSLYLSSRQGHLVRVLGPEVTVQ